MGQPLPLTAAHHHSPAYKNASLSWSKVKMQRAAPPGAPRGWGCVESRLTGLGLPLLPGARQRRHTRTVNRMQVLIHPHIQAHTFSTHRHPYRGTCVHVLWYIGTGLPAQADKHTCSHTYAHTFTFPHTHIDPPVHACFYLPMNMYIFIHIYNDTLCAYPHGILMGGCQLLLGSNHGIYDGSCSKAIGCGQQGSG